MTTMKYARMDWGTMEAVVNKLGGLPGVDRFLRGEVELVERVPMWAEQDGVISFDLVSEGIHGPDWITLLESENYNVGDYAKSVLRSPKFVPTPAGTKLRVNVVKGELFADSERITHKIRDDAQGRKLKTPPPDVACMIRRKFTDKQLEEMGLWAIIAMHDPIEDSGGDLYLLGARRGGNGPWLGTYFGEPGRQWNRGGGFAFLQVSS